MASKTSKKSKKEETKVNKSAWIRAKDPSIPAATIVAQAEAEGITLSLAQVYTARSTGKKKAKNGSGSAQAFYVGKPPKGSAHQDDALQFRRLVLSIGLARAESCLTEIKQSVGLG